MTPKVPVSPRALLQRINRALRSNLRGVRKARGDRWPELGEYYLMDFNRNTILRMKVDLEQLGRELEVLQPFEQLEEET